MINQTIEYMKKKQVGEPTGHGFWHSERVYKMALRIADTLEDVDVEVVSLAALLHDIEDWKFNDGDETAGPMAAKAWLKSLGATEALQEHVAEIIKDLSYKGTEKKSSMGTIEGMIVQDADRLDAMGAIGIARTFAFGGHFNNELFNPDVLPRLTIDEHAYKDHSSQSTTLNHFYEKLLNLKELMNTDFAKRIAEERHKVMIIYLLDLFENLGEQGEVHREILMSHFYQKI